MTSTFDEGPLLARPRLLLPERHEARGLGGLPARMVSLAVGNALGFGYFVALVPKGFGF